EQQHADVLAGERGLLHRAWRASWVDRAMLPERDTFCCTAALDVRRADWHAVPGRPTMPDAMTDPRLQRLIDASPGLRILTDAADLEHYGRDWTRRWTPA